MKRMTLVLSSLTLALASTAVHATDPLASLSAAGSVVEAPSGSSLHPHVDKAVANVNLEANYTATAITPLAKVATTDAAGVSGATLATFTTSPRASGDKAGVVCFSATDSDKGGLDAKWAAGAAVTSPTTSVADVTTNFCALGTSSILVELKSNGTQNSGAHPVVATFTTYTN